MPSSRRRSWPSRAPVRCRAGPRRGAPARTRSPAPATPARRPAAPPRSCPRPPGSSVLRPVRGPDCTTWRSPSSSTATCTCAPGGQRAVVHTVEHAGGQLRAVQVGDQFRAVIAVKARPAVGRRVQPHPGPPPGAPDVADRFGGRVVLVAPLVSAQPRQLIGDHRALEPAGGLAVRRTPDHSTPRRRRRRSGTASRRGPATARSPRQRRRANTIRGRPTTPDPDRLAGQRVAHEHHPAVVARDAAAAVGRRPGGQRQFRRQSRSRRYSIQEAPACVAGSRLRLAAS